MKIIKPENTTEIVLELHRGKILVLPSETSYGLSCDATSQIAVDKIFKIKGRSENKAVLVVVDSVATAKKYLHWNQTLEVLAQNYWGKADVGPLTIVGEYHKKFLVRNLAMGVVSRQGTLAVRVTKHPLLKILCEKIGHPLVSTSANLSGAGETYNFENIVSQFSNQEYQPDAAVDVGVLPTTAPSTIISINNEKVEILRQGDVKI